MITTHLHGSGVPRRVGAHLEEPGLCRSRLAPVPGRPPPVDHHGLAAEQAHEVGRLLALDHPHLAHRQQR